MALSHTFSSLFTATHTVNVYEEVMIRMIQSLEESLYLSQCPPVDREEVHYTRQGTNPILVRDVLERPSWVPTNRARVLDLRVVEFPGLRQTSDVPDEIATGFSLGPIDSGDGVL